MRHSPTALAAALDEDGRRGDWLARKLDVTPETVSRWRQGHVIPTDENKVRIAELLGRSVEALFFSSECAVITAQSTPDQEAA